LRLYRNDRNVGRFNTNETRLSSTYVMNYDISELTAVRAPGSMIFELLK